MATNHTITIPSLNGKENPSGTLINPDQPGPTQQNPLQCSYHCTICELTIDLLYVPIATFDPNQQQPGQCGPGFSLTDAEANNPKFGKVAFTYNPPLT